MSLYTELRVVSRVCYIQVYSPKEYSVTMQFSLPKANVTFPNS